MTGNEPEPNGWELLRGLKEVKEAVNNLAKGVVSETTFALYQSAQADREKASNDRIAALEAENADQRKVKAQMWFGIGLAVLTAVAGLASALIVWSITR